ncbi:protein FLUORESCENT IN BLUE LIGHT, chloroplastic-like isoform X2 [Zingiber officinale]|uniref:protein FLUORESCENT IN BLUE LIGHT, chloroplastic-like isoform X2 n=1 Tax=Zingiber officinale TaxID=94328 RepID=UPI001C4CCC9F|nr:protein FLUORESCENT IN BLUE LIGHT, chloroplastic-like isoform X2 [Zingiber officinale]
MPVLLHCLSSPPTAKKSGECFQSVTGRTHTERMVLSSVELRLQVLPTRFHIFYGKYRIPLSSGSINLKTCVQRPISEEICNLEGILSGLQNLISACLSDHQKTTPFSFGKSLPSKRSLAKVLAILHTWLLILPSKVLAETCEADNSFFNMPLLFAIAMIGATVGGLLARQRRGELKRLNDQLRQINAALRRQAKIESYAPNLSYAPVGSRVAESEVVIDPRKEHLLTSLRTGKNYLRNQNLEKAFSEFKSALELAEILGDHVEAKKAARGLGASLQRQGKYREAIKYHKMVLNISEKSGENSGVTEAYGAIADCFTELGELEQAGKFYDKYIARLESD